MDLETSDWFLNEMRTRRSVRKFKTEPVPDEIIWNAVKTAATSPSGANRQPWHFSIVKNLSLKQEIRRASEAVEEQFYANTNHTEWVKDLQFLNVNATKEFLEHNSHLIVVSTRLRVDPLETEFATKRAYYSKESVSIAIGLMIASLHLSGVATLTHTPKPTDYLSDILQLSPETRPIMIIITGYASTQYEPPKLERRALEEITSVFS